MIIDSKKCLWQISQQTVREFIEKSGIHTLNSHCITHVSKQNQVLWSMMLLDIIPDLNTTVLPSIHIRSILYVLCSRIFEYFMHIVLSQISQDSVIQHITFISFYWSLGIEVYFCIPLNTPLTKFFTRSLAFSISI